LSYIFSGGKKMETKYRSMYRWGGIASLLMTAAFAYIGIAIMLDPVERHRGEAFFVALAESPGFHMTWRYAFITVALLAFAFIPAAVRFVRNPNGEESPFLHWATVLAYVGTASLLLDTLRGVYLVNTFLIDAYRTGTEIERYISVVALSGGTDVEGFLQYGGVGLWYLAIALAGMRHGVLSRRLGYIGVAAGLGYISTLIFGLTDTIIPGSDVAVQALAALIAGVIVGPIFHVGFGLRLLQAANAGSVEAVPAPQLKGA
jgi:hypothetical protein